MELNSLQTDIKENDDKQPEKVELNQNVFDTGRLLIWTSFILLVLLLFNLTKF